MLRSIKHIKRGFIALQKKSERLHQLSDPKVSYYPEKKHKSRMRQVYELICWKLKYGELNKHYKMYGFDVCDPEVDASSYLDYLTFLRKRAEKNLNGGDYTQVPLLRDKYLFWKYMNAFHMPVPEVFAIRLNGVFYDNELKPISEDSLREKRDYFVKAIGGECGEFVRHIGSFQELCLFISECSDQDIILQARVSQHPEMSSLYPDAVNTIRIVTVMTENGPIVFSALQRIGTKSCGERDNTSQGGFAVGIKEDGSLMQFGFRKPSFGGRAPIHPDTGIVFAQFQIPHYQEALKTACKAHSLFYRIHSVGWDIAITEDGCSIIEGNDNWELQSFQSIYGGLREKCDRLL